MDSSTNVIEYKCPCCDGALIFGTENQNMVCPFCDNSFDIDTVKAYNEQKNKKNESSVSWQEQSTDSLSGDEENQLHSFLCPTCAGELLTDLQTVATFCPYCGNPTVLPGRASGVLRPDGVIPFRTTKEDAKAAFLKLCGGKPLLPKFFKERQQLEKITGIYVPFWLYDCVGDLDGNYKATRVHTWSDRNYIYTKTDHFMLTREAGASFTGIPMDGSSKMDDTFMESIEPFDYSQIQPFNTAFLSGFLADKYDVQAAAGEQRIRQRVDSSMDELLQPSFLGYHSVVPTSRQLRVTQGKARYILLPVWILNTRYRDKVYTFAMNGQTGKMTGSFPVCPKRTAAWFAAITAGVTLIANLVLAILA